MARLTPRERDVVRRVAHSMRNQEIAIQLNLSEHTVRNYLLLVFDKLGISSHVKLVLYAFSGVEETVTPEDRSWSRPSIPVPCFGLAVFQIPTSLPFLSSVHFLGFFPTTFHLSFKDHQLRRMWEDCLSTWKYS